MNTAEQYDESTSEAGRDHDVPALSVAGEIVEVRRNAGVSAGVGAVASAVCIAWFGRAISTGALLDWALVVLLGLLAVGWLAAFVDARTPLLVADAQGIRLRLGRSWLGLPWSAVDRVEHRPRRGLLRDGLLNVVPHNPDRLLAEVGSAGARQARVATRLHGGPLAVPLGLSTKVISDADLTDALGRLAERGAEVVVLDAPTDASPDADLDADTDDAGAVDRDAKFSGPVELDPVDLLDPAEPADSTSTGDGDAAVAAPPSKARPLAFLSRAATGVTALVGRRTSDRPSSATDTDDFAPESSDEFEHPVEGAVEHEAEAEVEEFASETPAAVRAISMPVRHEVVSLAPAAVDETSQLDLEGSDVFEEDQTWAERVSPISREGHAVAPLVLDDFDLEPATDPVVGPELKAARTRLGMSTDQLAERTRIRPHVIEAIEVDDFVPCGGDFYARGHLRTLARVLGVDVAPLLTSYDERYANAPIDPRRVFEAELAMGAHGSIRGTRGGPNWSILVAAVMALVLVWSVARLVMDTPNDVSNAPVLNGSGGPQGARSVIAEPVDVKVTAPEAGAEVVVRDANGAVVFQGELAIGETQVVEAAPPVRVQSSDGSVVVVVDGAERGAIGEAGEPGQGTYAGD